MKRLVAMVAIALAYLFVTPSGATSYSTDYSDLWWIPSESGWGIQFVQRGSVIFATMFVYDANGNPVWYTATLNPQQVGAPTWTGDLYLTHGPWFGSATFDPALVTPRKVGTMSWFGQFIEAGVLTYSVDGVAVTKNIQRQLLVYDDYNGTYNSGLSGSTTGCLNVLDNGAINGFATTSVTQTGQNVHVTLEAEASTITITGTLTQSGQFGKVSGTYIQSDGEVGNAQLFEMSSQLGTLTGRFSLISTNRGCQSVGYIGGSRVR